MPPRAAKSKKQPGKAVKSAAVTEPPAMDPPRASGSRSIPESHGQRSVRPDEGGEVFDPIEESSDESDQPVRPTETQKSKKSGGARDIAELFKKIELPNKVMKRVCVFCG